MNSVSMLHTNVKVQCVINKVIKVQSLAATHRDLQCTKAAMEFSHILTQGWTKSYNFNYQDLTYLDSHIQWAKRVNTNINTKDTTNIKCQKLDWPPPVKHRSGQIGWPAASGPLHIFTSSQKHANQICLTLSGCFFTSCLENVFLITVCYMALLVSAGQILFKLVPSTIFEDAFARALLSRSGLTLCLELLQSALLLCIPQRSAGDSSSKIYEEIAA